MAGVRVEVVGEVEVGKAEEVEEGWVEKGEGWAKEDSGEEEGEGEKEEQGVEAMDRARSDTCTVPCAWSSQGRKSRQTHTHNCYDR